jgi:hypothetical protein
MVDHASNPSYYRVGDQEEHSSRPGWAKSSRAPPPPHPAISSNKNQVWWHTPNPATREA